MIDGYQKYSNGGDGFSWEGVFQLPDAAYAGNRKIQKTTLVKEARLTRAERKVLDKVSALTHFATVQKSTTRIPPYIDDERDIQGVIFLHCSMRDSQAYAEVARLIHGCFPNPTVVLFGGFSEACISVAITRKSLVEHGSTVIEKIESTGRFCPKDERFAPFLEALCFDRTQQEDLLAYLDELVWNVNLSKTVSLLGSFPSCSKRNRVRLAELIAKCDELSKELCDIAKECRANRDLTLNETAKLRMKQKQLEKASSAIAMQIKEICDGGN